MVNRPAKVKRCASLATPTTESDSPKVKSKILSLSRLLILAFHSSRRAFFLASSLIHFAAVFRKRSGFAWAITVPQSKHAVATPSSETCGTSPKVNLNSGFGIFQEFRGWVAVRMGIFERGNRIGAL
jgi:hypothetical protein